MNQKYFVGVDISKAKLDFAVIDIGLNLLSEKVVANEQSKVRTYLVGLRKKLKVASLELMVCAEHTGIYSTPLVRVCAELGVFLWLENATKIKRASTDFRGKSDQKDARRIAEYALRYRDRAVAYQKPDELTQEIKTLFSMRETLLGQRVALENQLREAKSHDKLLYASLKKRYSSVLRTLSKEIKDIEEQVEAKVKSDPKMATNAELLQTIPGIGKQTALMTILLSGNFTIFTSAKHMACYAGVVPFPNQSGIMVKRDRVSRHANQKLKKLLHLAAMAATRAPGDLRDYFIRKVKEGKNKMSVINAIRNKLVHRMFSVINRQTPYIRNRQESFNEDSLNFA
ncbi:MAG: IS110 family transposase [Flavobacteriales bacterium]